MAFHKIPCRSLKMKTILLVSSNLKFSEYLVNMFEYGAPSGCGSSKEITLFSLFCYCRPKYSENVNFVETSNIASILVFLPQVATPIVKGC